jgi:micrococcal nuclease
MPWTETVWPPSWREGPWRRRTGIPLAKSWKRPIRSFILLLTTCLTLAACQRDGLDRLATGEQGRVAEIRSGDTLVLDSGLVVRLAAIDAPNLDQAFSREAAAALSRLAAGKDVELRYGGRRRDGYGRALAQVRTKGDRVWLQRRLIEQGAARVNTYVDNRALALPLLKAEGAARERKAGLWALPSYRVALPLEVRGRSGFQIVEGRVTGAYAAPGGAEMDLDEVVTVQIPERRLVEFARSKVDPGKLKTRLVRVRGYLRRDGTIKADHPEQVEVLAER